MLAPGGLLDPLTPHDDPAAAIAQALHPLGVGDLAARYPAPDGSGGEMITAVRFEGADLWIERSEILEDGRSTLGGELRFRRKPE